MKSSTSCHRTPSLELGIQGTVYPMMNHHVALMCSTTCLLQMYAFKERMQAVRLTEKWLMKEGKVQIRLNAVRTRSKGDSGLLQGSEQANDIASLKERILSLKSRTKRPQIEQEKAEPGALELVPEIAW